jgi:hypothetical protein
VTSESAAGRGVGRRLETPRAAGIAGLVFSLLFVVAILLSRPHPARGSTAEEIASFYLEQGAGRVVLLGLYLIPFSGIAFLWFIAAIRAHLGERASSRRCSSGAVCSCFLPRWLVLAGYVGGLVFLFTVTYVELLVLILPAWVTAVSVVILRAGFRRLSGATS